MEDLVLKGMPAADKTIPGIILNQASTVDGSILSDTSTLKTSLQLFLSTVVYANSDNEGAVQAVTKDVIFEEGASFSKLTVETLNGMVTEDFILKNSSETQA